jgi:RecA-family ATPase
VAEQFKPDEKVAHAQYVADALNTINLSQGAEREAKSDDKAPPKSDPRLLTLVWDGERELVFPTRLVQDLITENSIGLLAGESQAGKTFLAIDLTLPRPNQSDCTPFGHRPNRRCLSDQW